MASSKVVRGIDISSLQAANSRAPRSARDVADKKLRQELRAAGDGSASKRGGAERDEDLADFYRKRNAEKLEAAKQAHQKKLLENPTQSLLDCACGGSSRSDDLQFLIAKGVDLDDVVGRSEVGGESGRSALMAACQYGSQFGVEALVRAGADVDLRNELGVTALMMAVSYGQVGIVSFLLDHSGASPALVDASGHSALSYAYERGHASIASKLVKSLALPPARITTIAREKLIESRRKAEEAARQEREDKKALLARTIAEVKQAEADERK